VFHEAGIPARAFKDWRMAYLSPDVADMSRWSGLEGTGTIDELLRHVHRDTQRVPKILVSIVEAIAAQPMPGWRWSECGVIRSWMYERYEHPFPHSIEHPQVARLPSNGLIWMFWLASATGTSCNGSAPKFTPAPRNRANVLCLPCL